MSSESRPPVTPKSSVPEIKLPEEGFTSNLPQHLLKDCTPEMAWLLNEMSKNSAMTTFACHAVVETNSHLRQLNGRVYKSESNIDSIKKDAQEAKSQIDGISAFIKALTQFLALWEYRWFRWTIYAALIFVLFYLVPAYVQNPIDPIKVIMRLLFGT